MSKRETYEQLETSRARIAHENGHLRKSNKYLYDRLRRLENKVRTTIIVGEPFNNDGLYQLRQMVPTKPRPVRR